MEPCVTTEVSQALRLFGSIFEREVDRALLDELEARRADLTAAFGRDPLEGLDTGDPDAAVEALAVEYCRLFVGPHGHLPPTESILLGEGQLWGPAPEDVVEAYRSAGIEVSDSTVVPDHLAMELDCLAVLEETGRGDEAGEFARAHVLRWLPALIGHISERASIAFFPACAEGLAGLLTDLYAQGPAT